MKRHLLTITTLCFLSPFLFGQTVPNLDLETWNSFSNGAYEEPDGEWTTANKIYDLLPGVYPVTTLKTTDAHSGSYAARMKTDEVGFPVNLLVTGTLALGTFNASGTPPNNLKMGIPFTGRPDKFTGWYKCTSVNSDSSDMYALLSKWNPNTQMRDTIGYAAQRNYTTVSTYTQFDLPFIFLSGDAPDSLSIVFASSSDGKNFNGQVGNELYVDDLALETASGLEMMLMPEVAITVFPNPVTDKAEFAFSRDIRQGKLEILDLQGKLLKTVSFTGKSITVAFPDIPAGTYFYRGWDGDEKLNTGNFVITH